MSMKWLATFIISLYTLCTKFLRYLSTVIATRFPEPALQFIPFRKFNQSTMSDTFNSNDIFYLRNGILQYGSGNERDITGLIIFLYTVNQLSGQQLAEIIEKKYGLRNFRVILLVHAAIITDDGYYRMVAKKCESEFANAECCSDFGIFPTF